MENILPACTVLEQLSRTLNSKEQFQVDESFNLNVSYIHEPGTGSGRHVKLGTDHNEKMLENKKNQ